MLAAEHDVVVACRRDPLAAVGAVLRNWPVTILCAVAVGLLAAWPGGAALAEFDRGAIGAGEIWRFATGHLVHWNAEHLVWDLAVFVLLGVICEARDRKAYVATLVVSAAAISAGVLWLRPDMRFYRGLSGIDSALFVLAAALFAADARRAGDRRGWWCGVAALGAFAIKVGYEAATGSTIFVDSAGAGFEPMYLAHVIGGIAAAVVWGVSSLCGGGERAIAGS
jgi:rhomboid family GlyGly-CTERM serine protease